MDTPNPLVAAFYAAHPKYALRVGQEGGKGRARASGDALPPFVRWIEKSRPELAPLLFRVISEMLPDLVARDAALCDPVDPDNQPRGAAGGGR